MDQSHPTDLGGQPGRKLSPQAKLIFDLAVDLNRAYLAALKPPVAPIPAFAPDPIPPRSRLKYAPDDIIELAFAGNQLALFVLSSDMTECAVCGVGGANMGQPENHHPLCKVARWWRAVDALKIAMGVQ